MLILQIICAFKIYILIKNVKNTSVLLINKLKFLKLLLLPKSWFYYFLIYKKKLTYMFYLFTVIISMFSIPWIFMESKHTSVRLTQYNTTLKHLTLNAPIRHFLIILSSSGVTFLISYGRSIQGAMTTQGTKCHCITQTIANLFQ